MDEYVKVFEALSTLKEFCGAHSKCSDCPLRICRNGGECYGVEDVIPVMYDLRKPVDWRAFNV